MAYGPSGDAFSAGFADSPGRIDALREGREIHVIYDGRVHDGGRNKFCEDCSVEIKLKEVR